MHGFGRNGSLLGFHPNIKKAPLVTELFVDDTGLEPVTPTMSR